MKTSVFVGISVDGFMARANGSFDFLDAGGHEPHGYDEFMATVDALVIGRNTYEVVLAFEAWPYGDTPVFVLSSKQLKPAPAGAIVEHLNGSVAEICAKLTARGIQHAYIDGGITIQAFINASMLDRIIATRVPVLVGSGIPLFGPTTRDIALIHLATRTYAGGLVQSEYEISHDDVPGAS